MRVLTIAATLLSISWGTHGMSVPPSLQFYQNMSLVANDIYNMYWVINNDDIVIEVHAKTLGYVGFGISKTGGMKHADIVIGWVKDGKVYFQDRYSEGNVEPKIDESQDWKLLEGRERGEYTILKFSRALTNCDPNDIDITDETVRVIYAYHEDDPEESTGLAYHSQTTRGTKSLHMVSHYQEHEVLLPEDSSYIDFTVDKVEIPATDTTYYCEGFKVPKMDKKHHVIMTEPVITKGHEGLVHHMTLYSCHGEIDEDEHHGKEGTCLGDRMRAISQNCLASLFIYGIGAGRTFLPKETGIPLGGEDGITFLVLQIHYDNPPPSPAGIIDSSGMRIWLTPTLKEYDSWVMTTGILDNTYLILPPNFNRVTNHGYCTSDCLSRAMEGTKAAEGIHIYGAAVHSHLAGINLRLRHFRNGVELPPVVKDDYYDSNFQYMKLLEEPRKVLPTDDLVAECTYDTENRENITYGGQSARDEMCYIFVFYYPRMRRLGNCISMMPPKSTMKYVGAEIKNTGYNLEDFQLVGDKYKGKSWKNILESTDWSNKQIQEDFHKALTDFNSEQMLLCDAKPGLPTFGKPMNVSKIYVEEENCEGTTGAASNLQSLGLLVSLTVVIMNV